MGKAGCLIYLLLGGLLTGEVFFGYWIATLLGSENRPEYLGVILSAIGLSVAGWYLMRWRAQTMAAAVLGGQPGRAMVGLLGAILLIIPGFITAACGILLQIPPVQALFGKAAARLLQAYMKQAMSQMGGPGGGGRFGQMGGGGMPGVGGMGFPGMQPDDRVRKPKAKPKPKGSGGGSGKVIDADFEKE